MTFLFTSDQYKMLYIHLFFLTTAKKKILLEHVSTHMIKKEMKYVYGRLMRINGRNRTASAV